MSSTDMTSLAYSTYELSYESFSNFTGQELEAANVPECPMFPLEEDIYAMLARSIPSAYNIFVDGHAAATETVAAMTSTAAAEDPIQSRSQSQNSGSSSSSTVPQGQSSDDGRPHRCEFCQRGFRRKNDLKRHEKTHTGEGLHHCPHCDYRAVQFSNLETHVNAKHLNIKKHRCFWCPAQFADPAGRVHHEQRCHPDKFRIRRAGGQVVGVLSPA